MSHRNRNGGVSIVVSKFITRCSRSKGKCLPNSHPVINRYQWVIFYRKPCFPWYSKNYHHGERQVDLGSC